MWAKVLTIECSVWISSSSACSINSASSMHDALWMCRKSRNKLAEVVKCNEENGGRKTVGKRESEGRGNVPLYKYSCSTSSVPRTIFKYDC